MQIDLFDETEQLQAEYISLVNDIVTFAADYLKLADNTECAVTFVTNERIREINREYRQKDVPTDVISFALDDQEEDSILANMLGDMPHNLGDIIISIDRAKEQASEYNHSFERELGFLALHGFLHLNGYDHMNEADEKEMFGLQNDILNAYGLKRG